VLVLGVVSLLDIPLLMANTSMGETIVVLGPRGATGHGLPFVVRVALQGDVWVFHLSYGPPWAHYLSGYQDRLLGGPLGLLGLGHTAPDGVGRKDYGGGLLG
jgi:hypothetical protein